MQTGEKNYEQNNQLEGSEILLVKCAKFGGHKMRKKFVRENERCAPLLFIRTRLSNRVKAL